MSTEQAGRLSPKPTSNRFLEFVLDNLIDLITILAAGYLVWRHQVRAYGPTDLSELITGVVALLGLVAASGLWDRTRRLRRIEKLASDSRLLLLEKLSDKVSAQNFFLKDTQVPDNVFSSANTILIAGITLTRTTRDHMYVFGQRLAAGAHIRFIIIDNTKEAVLETMACRSMGDTSPEYWQTRMGTVTAVIEAIAGSSTSGKLEVGYLPYIPSFGIVMVDPDDSDGVCFVDLNHQRSAEPNPRFRLHSNDDQIWFQFFRNQFELMWQTCRVEHVPIGQKLNRHLANHNV